MSKKILALIVVALLFFSMSLNIDNGKAYSQSSIEVVNEPIIADTTWTSDNLYHVTGDINIASDVTLTIEAGTIVKLNRVKVTVNYGGNLTINGDENNKVILTSWRDDTIGEDVGDGTAPSKGNWRGIVIENGGTADINHVSMKYGGHNDATYGDFRGSITRQNGGTLNLKNSLISESHESGVRIEGGGTASINNTHIENAEKDGIILKNSVATINEVSIKNSGHCGIFSQDSAATISGGSIENSDRFGIWIHATNYYSGEISSIEDVTFIEDNISAIVLNPQVAGTRVTNCKMGNSAIQILGGTINRETTLNSKHTYYIEQKIYINSKLTISESTIIKLRYGGGFIINNRGDLNIVGDENNKVTLTSWRDNTIGEDIGDGTNPSGANWSSIVVKDGGAANIDYVDMKYVGYYDSYSAGGGIVKERGGTVKLKNSLIYKSGNYGIRIEGAGTSLIENVEILQSRISGIEVKDSSPLIFKSTIKENGTGIMIRGTSQPIIGGSKINRNIISGNTDFGVNNNTTTTIDGTYNWWGYESGPIHSLNPRGTGDKVSDYVDFIPFIEELVDTSVPNLTAGEVNRISHTEAIVKFTSDEEGEYFYKVVEAGESQPLVDTSGEGISCDATEQSINIMGLTRGSKDIYIVVKDSAGNLSDVLMINIPEYIVLITDSDKVAADKDALTWDIIKGRNSTQNSITKDLNLITKGIKYNSDIKWSSSDNNTISVTGDVYRPIYSDKEVTVTAHVYKSGISEFKDFELNVIKLGEEPEPEPEPKRRPRSDKTRETKITEKPKVKIYQILKYKNRITGINLNPVLKDNKHYIKVKTSEVDELISKAISKKAIDRDDTIEIKGVSSIPRSLKIEIPRKSFTKLVDKTESGLQINTVIASIRFNKDALETIHTMFNKSDDIEIDVDILDLEKLSKKDKEKIKDRPIYSFGVRAGDKRITDFGEGYVMVDIPYKLREGENPNTIVVYNLGDEGKLKSIRGHFNKETKTVQFKTNQFLKFIIGSNPISFKDVPKNAWYKDAVDFIAARGITTGIYDKNYSPEDKLTRGQFIIMMMRSFDIEPYENPKDNFKDAGDNYYTNYLAAAKSLEISDGIGNDIFGPNREITRQEMFTLLYNTLNIIDELPEQTNIKTLNRFEDRDKVEFWAEEAIKRFVKAGLINGDNGKLLPTEISNRAEMAQLLYNLLTK